MKLISRICLAIGAALLLAAPLADIEPAAASAAIPAVEFDQPGVICDDPFAIDLLIADQTMPGMTGDELALGAKAIRPDLPIILCAGYSARMNEQTAKQVGAAALLFKPLSRDDLAEAVAQALRSTAPATPVTARA